MAYNTKPIVTDKDGNPISQYYNPDTDSYEPVEGANGANKVTVENNDLSLIPILDKLSQLTGTVIDEETRKQNEIIRQDNEQNRIQLYNDLIAELERIEQIQEQVPEHIVEQLNSLKEELGNLEDLETIDKSSIVNAINEVNTKIEIIDMDAENVSYDNTESGLNSNNVKGAIDEVYTDLTSHKADNVHKQRTATVIVATYNSKQSSKDGADYVCSQTNAQEVINQAIQSIADTGGKVVLMEGIYNISSPIYINVSNVTLEGMGQSTVIDANKTPISCIGCENVENVTIKSITFKNTGGNYNCIHFVNVTNCVVADCKLVNNGGNGINMIQAIDSTVRNCISNSNGLGGIRLGECINCKIVNNICEKNFNNGIFIVNSSYCRIAGNILIDNTYQNPNPESNYGHIGMYAGGGLSNDNNYIVGNICRGQAHRGIAVRGSNNIVIHNDLRGSGTIELQDGGTNTITELAGNAISS